MSKFTFEQRNRIKNIVGNLSITRASDNEIIQEVERETRKTITRQTIFNVRQSIKKDSFESYRNLQQGKYEYLHEFKERINEIIWLQQKHNEIIKSNQHNPSIQQTSLAELHRLTLTLSNLYDVAPTIINNGTSLSATSETKTTTTESTEEFITV